MEKTVVTSKNDEWPASVDERLKQIDALLSCMNVVLISPEASLYTAEVNTLMGLSRGLIADCRTRNRTIQQ
ncbi:hypothetical protein F0327_25325 [Citrobacter braakii]|nr:hypothetical protein F0327_25325 [Citrobacter braakii]